jgi:ubiquinone/menaquinone biosynthesis C-methylase UbiE
VSDQQDSGLPPLPVRAIARTLSALIARAPFLWPVLKRPTQRFWDKTAPQWDARRDPSERAASLAAAVERVEPAPRRILELGTGTGTGALMLAQRFPGAEIWAADLSEEMIRHAEAKAPDDVRGRVHFEAADAAALPHDDDSFDLVCQLNMPLYATEIARVLAPAGYVAIAHTLGPQTPYYTPDSVLRRRFKRLGLEVLDGGQVGRGTYFLARRP